MNFTNAFRTLQTSAPLVQCITNFVTVNDCANMILAAGGSPTMAHDCREVEEAVAGVQALVCNMGAIEDAKSMLLAGRQANRLGKPVVLDPVAAGSTTLRKEVAAQLLEQVAFSVIRGNASEIRALSGTASNGSGVDVGKTDQFTKENLAEFLPVVQDLSAKTGAVIAVSGPIDLVCDGKNAAVLYNGCATMARITGSGCMLTALIGAFCGALPHEPFLAACSAVATMGICGEKAEQRRLQNGTGNATFRTDLIDAVFNLTETQLMEEVRYEIFK